MNQDIEVSNNSKTYKAAMEEFLLDISCLDDLKPWSSKVNIFDILKVSRTEIRHSNILSWLLDANENHGLDDLIIRNVIQIIVKNNREYLESKKMNVLKLLTLDFSNFIIMREWNSIDILLVSHEDKLVICIENKIGTGEHDNQLARYQEKVESSFLKNDGYDVIYIYLTPGNDTPSDIDNWIAFSYVEILNILKDTIALKELVPSVKLIIENYIETLRRFVVKDKELEEICVNLYKKHRQALDLIFDNKPDAGNIVSDIINEYLINRANEHHDIIFDVSSSTKTVQRFSTETFNRIFPPVPNALGYWGGGINYLWYIRNDYSLGKLVIRFAMCNYEKLNGGKTSILAKLLKVDLKENWQEKTFKSIIFSYSNKNQVEEFLDGDYTEIKSEIYIKLDKAMEKVFSFEKEVMELWTENTIVQPFLM